MLFKGHRSRYRTMGASAEPFRISKGQLPGTYAFEVYG
jgi:hypothetical protein